MSVEWQELAGVKGWRNGFGVSVGEKAKSFLMLSLLLAGIHKIKWKFLYVSKRDFCPQTFIRFCCSTDPFTILHAVTTIPKNNNNNNKKTSGGQSFLSFENFWATFICLVQHALLFSGFPIKKHWRNARLRCIIHSVGNEYCSLAWDCLKPKSLSLHINIKVAPIQYEIRRWSKIVLGEVFINYLNGMADPIAIWISYDLKK